jgi:DNA-binding LytR/AlgR family response regulator
MQDGQKKSEVPDRKHIMIRTGGTHTKIYLEKIVYAEVFNRKVIIHMTDGEIEYYGKLSDLEKMLGEDFFRPHRSYLIHFRYVVKYDASNIYLEHDSAPMAKQNYPNFVKQYLRYNQRKGSV